MSRPSPRNPKEIWKELIGGEIRKIRKARGLSQSALAERLGIPASSINHIEAGRRMPTVITLASIADELSVPLGQLIGRPSTDRFLPPTIDKLVEVSSRLEERDLDTIISLAQKLARS